MGIMKEEESIFYLNKKEEREFVPEQRSRTTIAFTYSGLGQDRVIDTKNSEAYARVDIINGRNRYYVKIGKVGRRNGQLPDPKSIEFTKGETSMKIGGIDVYDWIHVKKEVFDSYTKYLKTGEKKWLAEARNLLKVS